MKVKFDNLRKMLLCVVEGDFGIKHVAYAPKYSDISVGGCVTCENEEGKLFAGKVIWKNNIDREWMDEKLVIEFATALFGKIDFAIIAKVETINPWDDYEGADNISVEDEDDVIPTGEDE